MKVSVVIPAYNEEKYIKKCLTSLQKQKEKADEIIVVDNNCSDKTISIAKQFSVSIVKEARQGIIFARNSGFNAARYDIIARCDADTILPTDWITRIKKNFDKSKIDALTGPIILYDTILKTNKIAIRYFYFMKLIQKGMETLVGPNMALSKKMWDKVKDKVCLDDTKVHEDIDLAIHILEEDGIIKRDNHLTVKASGRRMKNNPISFFTEYPLRLVKTFQNHQLPILLGKHLF
ncbi:glycosyltransferase family 2 protein [Candidatus Roizmanbacteria bacterium]|jgi:glycosyltransferase involved in cell wall biosynthesis|nr:glycosyltransferase family 2 protein [Candidatus Roizmanbacteria bacterium]